MKGGDEVRARLGLVELGEEFAGLVLVARIAAQRGQRVRGEGDIAVERDAAGNVAVVSR